MKTLSSLRGLFLLAGALTQVHGADVVGVWTGRITFRTPDRGEQPREMTLVLKTVGPGLSGTLTGTWEGHRESTEILDGKLTGNEVSFAVPSGASDMPRIEFVGKQDGDNLTLTISGKDPKNGREWNFGEGSLRRKDSR